MVIGGMDLSITCSGVGIYDTSKPRRDIATRLIVTTGRKFDEFERASWISTQIVALQREYKVDMWVIEAPLMAGKTGGKSIAMGHQLFGAALAICGNFKTAWGVIAPATWRKMCYGTAYKLPIIQKTVRGVPQYDAAAQPIMVEMSIKDRAVLACQELGITLPEIGEVHNCAEAALMALCWPKMHPQGKYSREVHFEALKRRNDAKVAS